MSTKENLLDRRLTVNMDKKKMAGRRRVNIQEPMHLHASNSNRSNELPPPPRAMTLQEKLKWIEKSKDLHSSKSEEFFKELNPVLSFKKHEPVYVYGEKQDQVKGSSTNQTYVIQMD